MDNLPRTASGLRAFLNLGADRHWTVVVSDFALRRSDAERVRSHLDGAPTCLVFTRIDSLERQLDRAGVDRRNDYVSLQVIVSRFESIAITRAFFGTLAHGDMGRIDLPFAGTRFRRSYATQAIGVVLDADYRQQDAIADRFFRHLEQRVPYTVVARTADDAELVIEDSAPWFHLAGRMTEGESRALPGGEVAYTGGRVSGDFVVDGALLPSPQNPSVGRTAARLHALNRHIARYPLRLKIRKGRVTAFDGDAKIAVPLQKLLASDRRYGEVTEVGISFNRACDRFIRHWPAASNEGRPGVHVAIGGDPDRRHRRRAASPLVHLDLMAATTAVWVNGTPFLKTS